MNYLPYILLTQFNFVSYELLVIFIMIFSALYVLTRGYKNEAALILFSGFSYVYSVVLKLIFRMQRPPAADYRTSIWDFYSFPSSHVIVYTAVLGYILFVFTYRLKNTDKLLRFVVKLFLSYLILLVGASRVYLGQHWADDVIWGYIFGILFFAVVLALDKKIRKSVTKNKN